MSRRLTRPTLFPYTTLFRSEELPDDQRGHARPVARRPGLALARRPAERDRREPLARLLLLEVGPERSEEHTSELQSQSNLVCRLLLDKRNGMRGQISIYTTK